MATFEKVGYGQVEPNHLSAQRTSQIYAQLPAAAAIKVLENGQYVKYDYENNEVNFTGAGEWMMVFNEVKLYDDWRESYKDFAMTRVDAAKTVTTEGINAKGNRQVTMDWMVPRVIKTNVGDIYTTNAIADGTYTVGSKVAPGEDGFLAAASEDAEMVWNVVAITTMPDGQPAVKLQRIK